MAKNEPTFIIRVIPTILRNCTENKTTLCGETENSLLKGESGPTLNICGMKTVKKSLDWIIVALHLSKIKLFAKDERVGRIFEHNSTHLLM